MTSVIPVQILKALGIRNFPYIRNFFRIYKITLGARGFLFFRSEATIVSGGAAIEIFFLCHLQS